MDKEVKAQALFENYDFGENLIVVDFDSWDVTPGDNDWIRIVYVQDSEKISQDCEKISFHVKWKSSDDLDLHVDDVYALEIKHGQEIGCIDEKFLN